MRVERLVRTSVPAHPMGCCCQVYKGTTSPQTPRTPQGMLLSGLRRYTTSPHKARTPQGMLPLGLRRYYLCPQTPHTPRYAAVGFTKVLPLPTKPAHPKVCCCQIYEGITSPHKPRTPQGMLLSGLRRYYLSRQTPPTPRDAAVGFYKGTKSPQTPRPPQRMLL